MTWDQVLVWLILPAIGTIVIVGGAVWPSQVASDAQEWIARRARRKHQAEHEAVH